MRERARGVRERERERRERERREREERERERERGENFLNNAKQNSSENNCRIRNRSHKYSNGIDRNAVFHSMH